MKIYLKDGIEPNGLDHVIWRAVSIAAEVWRDDAAQCLTVTSAVRPPSGRRSLHWYGLAVDLRIWGLSHPDITRDTLAQRLGPDFDVVLETDHIHVEFDPARGARQQAAQAADGATQKRQA